MKEGCARGRRKGFCAEDGRQGDRRREAPPSMRSHLQQALSRKMCQAYKPPFPSPSFASTPCTVPRPPGTHILYDLALVWS